MQAKPLSIFCDLTADADSLGLLQRGAAPHRVVFAAKPAATVLSKSESELALLNADIAFGQPDVAGVLQSSRLRWVQISSAGYTRYDTPAFRTAASEQRLVVTNSSTVYAEPCAEHALAFMLAQARMLPTGLRAGANCETSSWARLRGSCTLLKGQSAVFLGFGSIGRHLAELLRPFGMKLVAVRRRPAGDEGIPVIGLEQLDQTLPDADHVVNLLPANPSSVGFMSAARFANMKPGAVFYNIGRGATVDQEALAGALHSGHLSAAWLDVTEPEPLPQNHPLLSAPNCFITPHLAGGHRNESEMLVRHFLENLRRFVVDDVLRDRIM